MSNYYVPISFRRLTEDEIGLIQFRLHDLNERAAKVADDYKVSLATIYRVKNAVPKHLLSINEEGVREFRDRKPKKRRPRKVA